MSNSITVREESNYKFWKMGTYLSAALCLVLFLIFWNVSDPFWGGIFRFVSFIFFALAVLGSLQIMNGPLVVTLSSSDDRLEVVYRKKKKALHKEQYKRSTVVNVSLLKGKQNILQQYLQPNLSTMKINFSDSDRELHLFEFSGRPLYFDQASIQQLKKFFADEGIELGARSPDES